MNRLRPLACLASVSMLALSFSVLGCGETSTCEDCDVQSADASTDGSGGSDSLLDPDSGFIDFETGAETGYAEGGDACGADVQTDPFNCGACGNVCSLGGAFPKCAAGQCVIDSCAGGFYDLNGDISDGCEYSCTQTNGGVEICDAKDNDCDGQTDEGFDLTSDPNNCGSCGNVCALPNASSTCTQVNGFGKCAIDECDAGYGNPNAIDEDGCEYVCDVYPPVAEVCNALDDNCDGKVNEGNPGGGEACDDNCPGGVCTGACTPGTTVCTGASVACVGGQGPTLEICDGIDNNCDGQTDEGFNTQSDPLNCGSCGKVCQLPNAVAGCSSGGCVIIACKPGFENMDGNPQTGCNYACPVNPKRDESCNGLDDDCDGQIDEGLTAPPNLCVQTGPCNGSAPVCTGTTGWRCNYKSKDPRIEVTANGSLALSESLCDGFDNNCNGQPDEAFANKGQPCSVGKGICAGEATYVCATNGAGTVCPATANPTAARDELCNGKDDNCDGQIDEAQPIGNLTCYGTAGAHPCTGWKDLMVQVGTAWVYRYEASRPDATADMLGTSDARTCSRSGVMPWTSVTKDQAAAACASVKDSTGAAMRLCTSQEWNAACRAGISADPIWSFKTNPTTYAAGVCNDANYTQIQGPWATGTGLQCAANIGAGLFDLSGNVSEWTSTCATVSSKTYCDIRGGNYQTLPGATTCGFDFVIQVPTFANFDLGFRCCANSAP